MTMGTRAFSYIPTQLTSNEGKRNLCSQVFARSCMRPLTACVLQRAALQSPVLPLNASFQDLNILSCCSLCHRWLNGQSLALYSSREHPKLTKQLHYWNTTSRNSIAQTRWYHNYALYSSNYEDCGLMHFVTSPNNSPQKRAKSQCLNNLIPLFQFIYSKQSFFALRFICMLERERLWKSCRVWYQSQYPTVDHLACWFQKTEGKPRKPNKTTESSFSQKEHHWSSSQAHGACVAEFVHSSLVFCLRCNKLTDLLSQQHIWTAH